MMNRLLLSSILAIAAWACCKTEQAWAQNPYFRQPFAAPRPGLSPYLNLLRGGDPAANYYLGTLPERDRRANTQQFRSAIDDLDRRTEPTGTATDELFPSLPSTGHPTVFNNLGGYFNAAGPVRAASQAPRPAARSRGR